jgi:hypothetical protein
LCRQEDGRDSGLYSLDGDCRKFLALDGRALAVSHDSRYKEKGEEVDYMLMVDGALGREGMCALEEELARQAVDAYGENSH